MNFVGKDKVKASSLSETETRPRLRVNLDREYAKSDLTIDRSFEGHSRLRRRRNETSDRLMDGRADERTDGGASEQQDMQRLINDRVLMSH